MDETQTSSQSSNGSGTAPHWSTTLPAEQQGIPAVKEAPDLSTFVKRFQDQSSELGKRVRMPAADKPDEIKAFKDSVYKAGLFKAPPESPDKYEITRPENVPEYAWDEKTVGKFRELAHKHGITQEAMADFVKFDAERFGELEPILASDKEAAKKAVTEAWQKEGREYDDMMNLAVEGAKARLTEEEYGMLERTGLLNHPYVLSGLAKIGELFSVSGGETSGTGIVDKSAADEAKDIVSNPDNPKYKSFWSGDQSVNAYVQELNKKAYPGTY